MFYAAILHLIAGAVTGSVFKVRTLLMLLGLVLVELAILAVAHGRVAALWTVANLIGLQIGYFVGIFARGMFEQAGFSSTSIRQRRLP